MPLARFTCNFKCDKVRVIVAWGKNCREESQIKFLPLAIRFVKELEGSDSNPTYLDSLVERPSTPFSVHNQHRFSMPRFMAIVCFRGQRVLSRTVLQQHCPSLGDGTQTTVLQQHWH